MFAAKEEMQGDKDDHCAAKAWPEWIGEEGVIG